MLESWALFVNLKFLKLPVTFISLLFKLFELKSLIYRLSIYKFIFISIQRNLKMNFCSKTHIPDMFKPFPIIPFHTYRKYRPEYFEVAALLDLCGRVYDAKPDPPHLKYTPEEIADWILQDTGHPEYKEAFIKNEIDGKSIIFLEADKFPRISIRRFNIIKELTAKIRNVCGIDQDEFKRSISLPIRKPQTLYLWYKSKRTGPTAYFMTPTKYFKVIHIIPEEKPFDQYHYALLNHWNRIPSFIPWCPKTMIGANRRVNPMTGTTQRQNFHPNDHPYILKEHALCMYHFPCNYEFPIRKDSETKILEQKASSELDCE